MRESRSIRDWFAELDLADRREKSWRDESEKLWDRYESEKENQSHQYNILWSNTEVLRASLFNSLPEPDVRRRFKDADPVGREVSELLERSLAFGVDDPSFASSAELSVLDLSLTGRGVVRVKYDPAFDDDDNIDFERAVLDHVQWDDFRRGCGKTWDEITWVGFRHRMTREELREHFPRAIADQVKLDEPSDEKLTRADDAAKESYQTATVTEVWDRDSKSVLFINDSIKDQPLRVDEDPLKLSGFFPCPEPARLILSSRTIVPIPHYRMYKRQAEELENIVRRINGIVNAMRVRGIKDPRLPELDAMFEARDTQFVAIQNQSLIAELGGIDKAIWMMPVDKLVQVLQGLYQAADAQKQQIYEIAGMADIMRGQSDPREKLGTQQLKSQWGSLRLQKAQREVQRFIRDALRIQAEIIGNRFQPTTIAAMTGMQPTPQAIAVMQSPSMRQFRVDVETDSTIADAMQADMSGLKDVLTGLTQWGQGAIPLVQTGLISPEAVKQVSLAITRRARLGSVVEDALDGQGAAQIGPDGQIIPAEQLGPSMQKDAEEFLMNQVQQSVVALQQSLQRFEQERQAQAIQSQQMQQTIQQTLAQTVEAVKAVLTDVQQRMAQMQEQHAQSMATNAEVHQRTVEGTAGALNAIASNREAQSADLSGLLAGLTEAVRVLAAPRQMQIQRDESGRPVGGVSAPMGMQ